MRAAGWLDERGEMHETHLRCVSQRLASSVGPARSPDVGRVDPGARSCLCSESLPRGYAIAPVHCNVVPDARASLHCRRRSLAPRRA